MTLVKPRGRPPALPAITLSQTDFDQLERLVGDLPGKGVAGLLQQELDRAKVCKPKSLPANVVSLNRWVHYTDGQTDKVRRVQLVMPHEADIDAGKVSILSYVGAGLLGVKEGQTIHWPDASGELRKLTPILIEDEDLVEQLAH